MSERDPDQGKAVWRPGVTRETLVRRAEMLERLRHWFADRDVLEVQTPVLSRYTVSDPNIHSLTTTLNGTETFYLHTSPEFPMKRLLAAGSGDIYQVCPVFRDGEHGSRHNPEFTMIEWYRIGFDHHDLMRETAGLIGTLLAPGVTLREPVFMSYRDAFREQVSLDPFTANIESLRHALSREDYRSAGDDRNTLLDLIMAVRVAPGFAGNRLTCIYDFPEEQAALARIRPGEPPVAERFEVFHGPMELANGFHELADADEQRGRFERELGRRRRRGDPTPPMDKNLLDALAAGLPDCAGVALGFDRLVMLATGRLSIDAAIPFALDRV